MLNVKMGLRTAVAGLCVVAVGMAVAQGIPRDQWNANERNAMEVMRKGYEAQGMSITEEQSELAVKSLRDQIARMMGAAAGAQMAAQMQGAMPRMPMAPMQAPMMGGAAQSAGAAAGGAGTMRASRDRASFDS